VPCKELKKLNNVICVPTSESARSIIIRIAVSLRTFALEVYSRRAALAYIWIVESTTTAVLISLVSQTRAHAGYLIPAIPVF
jgi:hypothetical protein